MAGVEQLQALRSTDAGCRIQQGEIRRDHRYDPRIEEERPVGGFHFWPGEAVGAVKAFANNNLVSDEFYVAL